MQQRGNRRKEHARRWARVHLHGPVAAPDEVVAQQQQVSLVTAPDGAAHAGVEGHPPALLAMCGDHGSVSGVGGAQRHLHIRVLHRQDKQERAEHVWAAWSIFADPFATPVHETPATRMEEEPSDGPNSKSCVRGSVTMSPHASMHAIHPSVRAYVHACMHVRKEWVATEQTVWFHRSQDGAGKIDTWEGEAPVPPSLQNVWHEGPMHPWGLQTPSDSAPGGNHEDSLAGQRSFNVQCSALHLHKTLYARIQTYSGPENLGTTTNAETFVAIRVPGFAPTDTSGTIPDVSVLFWTGLLSVHDLMTHVLRTFVRQNGSFGDGCSIPHPSFLGGGGGAGHAAV